jgi:iron(III) transport system substrate-binding protein
MLILAVAAALLGGCKKTVQAPDDPRAVAVEEQLGKSLDELPLVKLVAISPHNKNITDEYEWAFSLYHAVEFGSRVDIEWRDVGGGSSTILTYLRNVYGEGRQTCGIDIVWGGGEHNFIRMAGEGMLEKLTLGDDIGNNIPATFGGVKMMDEGPHWIGSALSGFGFLYNKEMLAQIGVDPPTKWADLGADVMFGHVCLADPMQSGSAAAAYEMIVQSAEDWPSGWARLLGVLSNAGQFEDSAGASANAPGLGKSAVATCIDFYGTNRVVEAPDVLIYISPAGQTAFTPDPIAVLKGAPNEELAQRFVNFVLSAKGQALLALRVGETDGPIRTPLGRQPIRRDVYATYTDSFSPWVVNPYQAGNEMTLDMDVRAFRYEVLKYLISAAAVDNLSEMKAARRELIDSADPAKLAEFVSLPSNIATVEGIRRVSELLGDPTEAERIVTEWQRFFRDKYRRIVE